MKRITTFLLVLTFYVSIIPCERIYAEKNDSGERIIYVAPNGSDNNNGSERSPLKTLEGAKNTVRNLMKQDKKSDITVIFKEGDYRFEKGVQFSSEDSGNENATITYKAEEGAKVNFKGSVELDASDFKYVDNKAILERIPKEARPYVGQLDITKFGIKTTPEFGHGGGGNRPVKYYDLFLDDTVQTLSRWPNLGEGYARINEIISAPNCIFRPEGSRVSRWGKAKNVQLSGYISNTYAFDRTYIEEINTEERTLEFWKGSTTNGLTNTENRFFVSNLLEEIDEPGEWYIDKDTMILYYYPPHPLSDEKLEMSVLREDIISMKNASYINIDGITFTQTCRDAISLSNTNHIEIRNCLFKNIGRETIMNNFTVSGTTLTNGANNTIIENNEFYDIGGYGVYIAGGDFTTLEPSGNIIRNNHIHHYQTYARYGYAIGLSGVGNEVYNNTIHDAPHGGISFNGNDHKIMYNELYDLCKESSDCGALYSGRNLHWRGVEIAYNYIHDIKALEDRIALGQYAVYFDDRLSEGYVHHNIIENCMSGIFFHGGYDAHIENNIIINTANGARVSHCGSTWRNLYEDALEISKKYPAYSKYKGMNKESLFGREDFYPRGNYVANNFFANDDGASYTHSDRVELGTGKNQNIFENNIVDTDFKGFVDRDKQNFAIKEGDAILEKIPGLASIKMEEIGVLDKERVTVSNDYKFIKTAPKNDEKNVNTINTIFAWEHVPTADHYRLVIAKDADMKDIVYDEIIKYNGVTLNVLQSGGNRYYWDVTAYNNSKDGTEMEIKSFGAPYLLTTSKYDDLDKIILGESLKEAKTLYSSLVVGDEMGQCTEEDMQKFKDVIDSSEEVYAIRQGTQTQIDEATKNLNNAVVKIQSQRKPGYRGIDDMIKSIDNWNLMGGGATGNSDGKILTTKEHTAYKMPIEPFEILKFKIKVDFNDGWIAFGVKQASPGIVYQTGGTGYFWAFKKDLFEYQRFVLGSGGFLRDVEPNDFIKDGEWHDIEIGSVDTEIGSWNYLKIDDNEVLNALDSEGYISGAGLFQLYSYGGAQIQIATADNMDEKFDTSKIKGGSTTEAAKAEDVKNLTYIGFDAVGGNISDVADGVKLQNGNFSLKRENTGKEVFIFDAEFSFEGSNQVIGVKADDIDKAWNEANGYFAEISDNNIKLLRRTSKGNITLGIVKNRFIKSGEKVNIEFGAYPSSGGTRIVLFANGSMVFDYTERDVGLSAGKLNFYDVSGKGITIYR